MVSALTSGIRISVTPHFEPEYLEPGSWNYFFSYRVHIENTNSFPIQLLSREWHIYDTVGEKRIVKGMGVVGETPVIQPGESYVYSSACDLKGSHGYMGGHYLMIDMESGESIHAEIPRFNLEVPFVLN